MDKLALITRNTEEIVTKEELEALVNSEKQPSAYVGYEPSGKIHMGHVLQSTNSLTSSRQVSKLQCFLQTSMLILMRKGLWMSRKNR